MCAGHSKQGLSDASDLKNPGEQAGGHGDRRQSVQPVPTPSDCSTPWLWDPKQVTKPLWACFLIGTMSYNEKMRGKHLPSSCQAPRKCLICMLRTFALLPTGSCEKHYTLEPSIQSPSLLSFLRILSHTWLNTGQSKLYFL